MDTASEPLTRFADGVWLTEDPVRIVGMPLTSTMTVLRLGDGGLLLYSPVAMTAERRSAVEALGPIAHLYAPNLFHHRWLGEWAAAFPSARLHAPRGLAKKRPDLRVARIHGETPDPSFEGSVDELSIAGFRLQETALLYRPAQSLLVADLVHNVGRPEHLWTAVYTRAMGFYGRVALSRAIKWPGFDDRRAARGSIDAALSRGFERMIVGHGAPLREGARDLLAAAYDWLGR